MTSKAIEKQNLKCGCGGNIEIYKNYYEHIYTSEGKLTFWSAKCTKCSLHIDGGGGLFGKDAIENKEAMKRIVKQILNGGQNDTDGIWNRQAI